MIEVINLGVNNIRSVVSALESQTSQPVRVISEAHQSRSPRLMVLPGTGSFGTASAIVEKSGFTDLIKDSLGKDGYFFAGICLGMQLLAITSEESPGSRGLGIVDSHVSRLREFPGLDGRVPHVGWESVSREKPDHFKKINDESLGDVYFSHGYHLLPGNDVAELLWANSPSRPFLAAIRVNNVSGYQFHPEKSSKTGILFLKELLSWSRIEI